MDLLIGIVGRRWSERTRLVCRELRRRDDALCNGRLGQQWKERTENHTVLILSEMLGNDWRKSHQGETSTRVEAD